MRWFIVNWMRNGGTTSDYVACGIGDQCESEQLSWLRLSWL